MATIISSVKINNPFFIRKKSVKQSVKKTKIELKQEEASKKSTRSTTNRMRPQPYQALQKLPFQPNVCMFRCSGPVCAFTALALGKKKNNHHKQRKNNEGFFHLQNIWVYKSWKDNMTIVHFEPMTRIELVTPSLPRKYSTPELHRQNQSGRRDSNPRPSAWKANALSTELLPQCLLHKKCRRSDNRQSAHWVGKAGFEPTKAYASRFTVCPSWPLWYFPKI